MALNRIPITGLQLIINTETPSVFPFLHLVEMAIAGGVDSIQLRHKQHYDRKTLQLAFDLSRLCHQHHIPFIINDRIDIALAVNASGVHLGQTDMPLKMARQILGDTMVIGATISTLKQALIAEEEGADYLGLGHIYPTTTKVKSTPPIGINGLQEVCSQINTPILAIGGINETNIMEVCSTTVSGIAIVSAIANSKEPESLVRKIKQIIHSSGSRCS
jgi:thiamine-phosphate diphosphorylase